MNNPHLLRQSMRHQRRSLTRKQQQQAAEQICSRLLNDPSMQRVNHIALYAAFDGEIETHLLCQQLWQQKKQLYLPILPSGQKKELLFVPYGPQTVLAMNRFGINEPQQHHTTYGAKALYTPLEIIVLPVVAFDRTGYRLGMGGGYYDCTLAHYATLLPPSQRPYTIGLAHDFQQVAQLPTHTGDVPLHVIVTATHY